MRGDRQRSPRGERVSAGSPGPEGARKFHLWDTIASWLKVVRKAYRHLVVVAQLSSPCSTPLVARAGHDQRNVFHKCDGKLVEVFHNGFLDATKAVLQLESVFPLFVLLEESESRDLEKRREKNV